MQPRDRTTTTIGQETGLADATSTTDVPASAPAYFRGRYPAGAGHAASRPMSQKPASSSVAV